MDPDADGASLLASPPLILTQEACMVVDRWNHNDADGAKGLGAEVTAASFFYMDKFLLAGVGPQLSLFKYQVLCTALLPR